MVETNQHLVSFLMPGLRLAPQPAKARAERNLPLLGPSLSLVLIPGNASRLLARYPLDSQALL